MDLKEAASKALTGRTEIAYEAGVMDEETNISKVQCFYGNHVSICGGYKCEGGCALPGEICRTRQFRKVDNRRQEASLNLANRLVQVENSNQQKCYAYSLRRSLDEALNSGDGVYRP